MEDGDPLRPGAVLGAGRLLLPAHDPHDAVRVIKGPAAIAYGPHTVGGAIDFVSRPIPTRHDGRGRPRRRRSTATRKVHGYFGAGDERLGFLVEGVRLQNDGFKRAAERRRHRARPATTGW